MLRLRHMTPQTVATGTYGPGSGSRYCDFCREVKPRFAAPADQAADRDICPDCALEACKLLGVHTEPLTTRIMSTLSNLMRRLLDTDTKKLVKAGLLDDKLQLTKAGEDSVLSLLVVKFKADLVKEADDIIAAAEEKK